jgi:hypothetical protein
LGNKIKVDEIRESCGTHGGEKKCRQVLAKKLEGRELLGRPTVGVDEGIILWQTLKE